MDLQTCDHLLTTTRTVRKRLDFDRPVDPEVVLECLRIAIQAPTGSNEQGWRFLIVTDEEKKKALGELYGRAFQLYAQSMSGRGRDLPPDDPRAERRNQVVSSAQYLANNLHRAPVLVLACIQGKVENQGVAAQASLWGSILPAAWSLMLALRARGLGSAWTTLHLMYQDTAAKLLGIPEGFTQAVLLPVAYFKGEDFQPARRLAVEEITYWNSWGKHRV